MRGHQVAAAGGGRGAVRVQRDDEQEVALVGVRLALLAHVVRRRLAEVQPADRHLARHVGRARHPAARGSHHQRRHDEIKPRLDPCA